MDKQDRTHEMYDLVEQWQQSGVSQKQFSCERNIKLPTFMYWVKKYRLNKQDDPGFAPIAISDLFSLICFSSAIQSYWHFYPVQFFSLGKSVIQYFYA